MLRPPAPNIGVNVPAGSVWFHQAGPGGATPAERVMALLAEDGFRSIRFEVSWNAIQPRADDRGRRIEDSSGWWIVRDRYLPVIEAAAGAGMRCLVNVMRTPPWAATRAATGDEPPLTLPCDADAYGAFVAALVRWFTDHCGRGVLRGVEVWNEPNHHAFWRGTPHEYARLVAPASAAVVAVDPGVDIVVGAVSGADDGYLAAVLADPAVADGALRSAGGPIDAISCHPYPSPSDLGPDAAIGRDGPVHRFVNVAAVEGLAATVPHGPGHGVPVWLTEVGWSSHGNRPDTKPWRRGVDDGRQAECAELALHQLAERFPSVTHLDWFTAWHGGGDPLDPHLEGLGLYRADFSRRPVVAVLRRNG